MKWTGQQIAAATGGVLHGQAQAVGPVLTDSRSMEPGAWFLAIEGDRFDGHAFAEAALKGGASGGVFRELPEGWEGPWVEVADTVQALQDLGRAARARLKGKVIALTGTSGKTTTRALLSAAFAPFGLVHQTVGNLNNHLGVPMTLLAAPEDADFVVVEMGTSGPGEIAALAEIATPDVRMVLNIGEGHLEELHGLDGVAREKTQLYKTAKPSDWWLVNLDDPRLSSWAAREDGPVMTWGRSEAADARLMRAEVDQASLTTTGEVKVQGAVYSVTLPSPGLHFAHNAAGVLAAAHALGLDIAGAAAGLSAYNPVGMRMKIERLANGVICFNDAYNANPASMKASLQTLGGMDGRRVAVLGDMLELGSTERELHREVIAFAQGLELDLLVLVGPRMGRESGVCEDMSRVIAVQTPEEAGVALASVLRAGDHVLFKGSRGSKVEQALHRLKQAYAVESAR